MTYHVAESKELVCSADAVTRPNVLYPLVHLETGTVMVMLTGMLMVMLMVLLMGMVTGTVMLMGM
jgi:hypothetical protein